jgi:hypothetical protein
VLLDAIGDCAVRFDEMSDSGKDSYYGEAARKWRHVEYRVKTVQKSSKALSKGLSGEELQWVIAAYLWCSINHETSCFK